MWARMPIVSSSAGRLAVAVLAFGIALGSRIIIEPTAPGRLPFLTFFPAVLATAIVCGYRYGLFVLAMSALAGAVIMPDSTLVKAYAAFLFAIVASLNIYLVEHLLRTREQLRIREEQLAVVNRELKHRIKNMFAIAAAICRQTLSSGLPPSEMNEAIQNRLRAMAAAQDAITDADSAEIGALVATIVAPISPARDRLRSAGAPARIGADAVTGIALILNELATNALKHGAWSNETGTVQVEYAFDPSGDQDEVELTWTERGGPPVQPGKRDGLGNQLIAGGLKQGTISHELRPDGLVCCIRFPARHTQRR